MAQVTAEKPRVIILTNLTDFSSSYSIGRVALLQVAMLKRRGHEVRVLCCENFNPHDKARADDEIFTYDGPAVPLHCYRTTEGPRDEWVGQVALFEQAYEEAVAGYDVVITHDLMFQDTHLPMNEGVRKVIERNPDKIWLHWVHSGPSQPPHGLQYPSTLRYSAADHSTYIFLNNGDRQNFANMIGARPGVVKICGNPIDIRESYGFSQETRDLITRYDLMSVSVLQSYPFSVGRWRDKGIRQLVRIFAQWKRDGHTAKLLLINAHSNGEGISHARDIEAYAKKHGLVADEDLILTSRYAEENRGVTGVKNWDYSVPKYVVDEIARIASIFIFPSISECCSLVQGEAALARQFVVLNSDFPPMLEFADKSVPSFEFTRNNPDDPNSPYYEAVAKEIWGRFCDDPAIQNSIYGVNFAYNEEAIWRDQFEPLLYRVC